MTRNIITEKVFKATPYLTEEQQNARRTVTVKEFIPVTHTLQQRIVKDVSTGSITLVQEKSDRIIREPQEVVVTSSSSATRDYKMYKAVLFSSVTTVEFGEELVVGKNYYIVDSGDMDFISVGASSEEAKTVFTATSSNLIWSELSPAYILTDFKAVAFELENDISEIIIGIDAELVIGKGTSIATSTIISSKDAIFNEKNFYILYVNAVRIQTERIDDYSIKTVEGFSSTSVELRVYENADSEKIVNYDGMVPVGRGKRTLIKLSEFNELIESMPIEIILK